MWALILLTAHGVCAREYAPVDTTDCDTVIYSISPRLLAEIVVTVDPVIVKSDRKVIRPDKATVEASADGLDLLRRLQLPRIGVNPMTSEIVMSGGCDVTVCINGVEATRDMVAALRPADIVRIEYHDSPGVRYAGADAVVDYITVRHYAGGSVAMDAFGAVASGRYASIDHLSAQYNCGRSVWNVNVGFMGQRKNRWIRNYDEVWFYPDAPLMRHEEGLPVTVGGVGAESQVNYNYLWHSGHMLDVRIGVDLEDVPDKEEGDRKAILSTSDDSQEPVLVVEHTAQHSVKPNIALHYLHKLSDRESVTFEAQGSYMRSGMTHEYYEDGIGGSSRVTGDRYSARMQGIYERRSGGRVWSAGVSARGEHVSNLYSQREFVRVNVSRAEGAFGGEYSDRFGPLTVTGRLRAVWRHIGQLQESIDGCFLMPSVNIGVQPVRHLSLRYVAAIDYTMPSVGEISDVSQSVQTGLITRGNPGLRPFRSIEQSANVSYNGPWANAEAFVDHRYDHRPVMQSVIFENGEFVRTYFNQRSFARLRAGASLSVTPWKGHLTLSASPILTRYFSRGIDYSHCHSIFRLGLGVDFHHGHWLVYGNIMSGAANGMYGEEIIEEKDMNQIMAGYKGRLWSLHLGVFNAFMRNYWMETRNLSSLTPYRSRAHSGRSSSYLAVRLNVAIDFGRKGRDVGISESDDDDDSGILTITR